MKREKNKEPLFPLPLKTHIGIPQKPAYRQSYNFAEPQLYHPERWLQDADSKFAGDQKDMFQPFLVGPRSCIGKR